MSTPSPTPRPTPGSRPKRALRTATLLSSEQLSDSYVRVLLTGDDLDQLPDLAFTDHYVKLLFAPAGADYTWPFDPEEIKASRPRTSGP